MICHRHWADPEHVQKPVPQLRLRECVPLPAPQRVLGHRSIGFGPLDLRPLVDRKERHSLSHDGSGNTRQRQCLTSRFVVLIGVPSARRI